MQVDRIKILKKIKPYINHLKFSIVMLIIISACSTAVSLISPKFFQILIDDVLTPKAYNKLVVVIVGLISVYIARFVLDGFNLFFSNRLLNEFTMPLRNDIFSKYLNTPLTFFEQKDIGDLKMRIMDDIDSLGNFIREQVVEYIFNLILIILCLYITVRINLLLTLYCVIIIPFVILINYVISKGQKRINEEIRMVNQEYVSSTYNSFQIWKEIKLQNAEELFLNRFNNFRDILAKLGMRSIRYWACSEVFNDFKTNYITKILVYTIGSFFVIKQQLSVGYLIIYAEYFSMLFSAIDNFNGKNVALLINLPYYKRVFDTLSFPEEKTIEKTITEITENIIIDSLSFGYYKDKTIIRDINLNIMRGECIAIVGKTGCGKTTLIKLMLGLYKPEKGNILYDNILSNEISKKSLYSQIGVVMQDYFLFNMSIRENLLLAKRDASEEEIISACKKADILDLIFSLPDGFNTIIGEQGIKLSGGQKQRLIIATIFLKKASVVIFDEATSSIDNLSENKILNSLLKKSDNITKIIISHKPTTTVYAEKIIVFEEDTSITIGKHNELLKISNYYKNQWRILNEN